MKNIAILFLGIAGFSAFSQEMTKGSLQKQRDLIIYLDSTYYAAFPSVVKRPNGDLLVAFRRAPDRKIFGETSTNHVDPNSYLVSVKSTDLGLSWSEPKLIYAHSFGGSQDPCLLQLRDGTLLCTSYGWAFVRPNGLPNLKEPYAVAQDGVIFLGGYLLRSVDGGASWSGPFYPPHIEPEVRFSALGTLLPAYNRGALCEAANGTIYWVVAASEDADTIRQTSTHLITSRDGGFTWDYRCAVARDETVSFNEASIYETPKGDLVAFLRTAGLADQACIARSEDGGLTFGHWQEMGFQGHPFQALRLPDNRVLLTYGYRHEPYGIRARVLNEECTDFASADEIIIRDDGGSTDIGYPWAVLIDETKILVTYYFNQENGPRHIAGSILEIR